MWMPNAASQVVFTLQQRCAQTDPRRRKPTGKTPKPAPRNLNLKNLGSYAKLKMMMGDANDAYLGGRGNKAVITMVAGGCAGALATSVSYPLDLLRTRLASYTGPIVGALERETLTGPSIGP